MSLEERLKYAEMKARHRKTLKSWYEKPWGIVVIVISGVALSFIVASGFYVLSKVQEIKQGKTPINKASQEIMLKKAIIGHNSYSMGNPGAKITIVEFADFASPLSQRAAPELKNIITKYQKQVKVIYRDYPQYENSIELALSARCAGEQGKFWPMHDLLFSDAKNLTGTGTALKTELLVLANKLNLDIAQFSSCYTNRKYISAIREDYQDGNTLQIKGTPTWFINNYPIIGYIPKTKFEELIDALLQQYKTSQNLN